MTTTATILDKPALGFYLRDPAVIRRRRDAAARGRWFMEQTMAEHHTRCAAMQQLGCLYDQIRTGRNLTIVAEQLMILAAQLETPEPLRCAA
jgi:hypothetical protein